MPKIDVKVDQAAVKKAGETLQKGSTAFTDASVAAGYELRKKIKEGIQSMAPAGETWPEAHPWTRHGSLRNLFGWKRSGGKRTWSATRYMKKRTRMSISGNRKPLARMAGAVRMQMDIAGGSTGGVATGTSRIDIGFLGKRGAYLAAYHAEAHSRPVTARMRRFFFAAGLGIGTSLRIPARPMVAPIGRTYGPRIPDFVRQRVLAAMKGGSGRGVKL